MNQYIFIRIKSFVDYFDESDETINQTLDPILSTFAPRIFLVLSSNSA